MTGHLRVGATAAAAAVAAVLALNSPPASGTDLDSTVRRVQPQVRQLDPQVRSLRQEVTDGARTQVTISADVLFDFDSDVLNPAARDVVVSTGRDLTGRAGQIAVVGHTDGIGTAQYNQDLSQRRAAAVAAVLGPAAGGRPVAASGRGASEPVAPEVTDGRDDPAGRALNRRVVITVSG